MMNEPKALVQKIQTMNKEVVGLQKQISIIGQEKLHQIIQFALKGLEFEEIYKEASHHDEFSDEEGEVFINEDGEVLKGIKVFNAIEDSDETDDIQWELHKEVFLLSDGRLKNFDTIYKLVYCSDCEEWHHSILERSEAETECESDYKNEIMISRILAALRERAELVEKQRSRLVKRLDDLYSLLVS
ncbi:hypothetical protein AB4Z22_19265 [Paenibacillus sp. TAF58]